jgi:hypothetical protein
MKKLFTLLSILVSTFSFAGTPTIDGVYNAAEGWGTAVSLGDGNVGWSNANAKKLYVTADANYVYFGAECSAESWQQFVFAVNTKAGGDGTDSWGRTITYNQTNKPDFLFRGDITGGNYAEYHVWNGTAWTGTGVNINAGGTEVKGVFAGTAPYNGFLEIRVPKATLGNILVGDVQFIITGNNSGAASGHGCFDAIPNDNNCTGWSSPTNASVVSNYATNVTMPSTLGYFKGEIKNGNANLSWSSNNEINFSHYELEQSNNATNWTKIATVLAKGSNSNYTANAPINQNTWYRLKLVDKDGSFNYCNAVLLKVAGKKSIELLSNPVTDLIKVSINNDKATNYSAEIFSADGKRIATKNYAHPGGVTTFSLDAPTMKGLYYIRFTTNGLTTDVIKVKVD